MNKTYNLAIAIFGDKIEAPRDDVSAGYTEASEAIEELAMAICYCDAFTNLDSVKATELAQILITE